MSFGFNRHRRRSASENAQISKAGSNPVEGPDCSRLQAERAGLQARMDAIELLCAKWRSLVKLNETDSFDLVKLEARFGALAPSTAAAANEGVTGGLGKGRGSVAAAQTANRKARLDDVEKLRVRTEILRAAVTNRSDQLDLLARRIDIARSTLAPRVEHWNRATERGHCGGPPLDLYPTAWPSFAPWPQRDITPGSAQDWPDPGLVDYRCEGLFDEISQHNRRVAAAAVTNSQRLDDLAELEGKLEALRLLATDIGVQWLRIKNELVWRDQMSTEGDRSGHMRSSLGLASILDTDRSSTAAGFGQALFGLSSRQSCLQSQIDAAKSRLNARASQLSDQIRLVAEPLRTQAIELEYKLRHCRQSDPVSAVTQPAIHRLSMKPPVNNRWVRAQNHLRRIGTNHLSADQITYVLNNARTW